MYVGRVLLGQVIGSPVVQQTPSTTWTSADDPLRRVPGFFDAIIHGHTSRSRGEVEFNSGRALVVRDDLSEDSFENRAGAFGETVLPRGFDARMPNLGPMAFTPGDEFVGAEFGTEVSDELSGNSSPRKPEPAQGVRDSQDIFVVKNPHVAESGSTADHIQGPSLFGVGGFQLNQAEMNDISEISGLRKLASSANVISGLFEADVALQVLSSGDDVFADAAKAESTCELLVCLMSERFVTSHQCAPECRVSELLRGCFRFSGLWGGIRLRA